MAKIGAMLDIGKRSMLNSQTALQTVSHNIANKSTEGYSRQRVELQTNTPITEGRLQLGMGNRAAAVTRTNNPYLEKQLQKETQTMGYHEGRAEGLSRVEQVFNEQQNKGLNQYLTDFFNSFRELSNNPESTTTRTMVKEAAEGLAKDFKRVNHQLNEVQRDLDEQVRNQVGEVNKMTREIASLNEQVSMTEVQGMPANDQRDRRDLLLRKLNEKIDIHWAEGTNGLVTVQTAGTAILVSGYDTTELSTAVEPSKQRMQVFFKANEGTPPLNITDRIRGGSMGGALAVRDDTIVGVKDNIDELAYNFATEVNKAHVSGFDRAGNTGVQFFQLSKDPDKIAEELTVNKVILEDVSRIAAGAKAGAPGDNTVANVISQLQYREVMGDNSATLDDFYNSQVGSIGAVAQQALKARESQQNVLEQLNNIRESVSGVSLDEETTKMIEFQRAFDASARVIRTADEMFDTVLNLKRL